MISAGSIIGGGSVLLPGVSIGENSIVAASSVVKDNLPDNSIVAGVLARVKTSDVYSGLFGGYTSMQRKASCLARLRSHLLRSRWQAGQ